MQPPILITGAARSGTSMVAGIIDMCGAWGGDVCGPTPANRKGQFENRRIVQTIIKPYLAMQGFDPMGQAPLPNIDRLLPFDNLRQRIEGVMREDGYAGGPWYWKGAKACLLWPVLHAAFPDAKWVIVRREPADIVRSCMRTGFMHRRSTSESWMQWVCHHEKMFVRMQLAGLQIREVWPRRLFIGDFVEMRNMVQWLGGLKWDMQAILDFVEPSLWHAKEE